jgi:hypothetical protein
MRSSAGRRFWEIMIGLLLLILGFAGVAGGSGQMLAVMFFVAGFWLLARQFDTRQTDGGRREQEMRRSIMPETLPEQQAYTHAVEAARRAGHNPQEMQVLPVDIGLMAFRGERDPVVHRSQALYDDVDYIQPFVQLRLPTQAVGRIRFEIYDSDGQLLFIREEQHQLQPGLNLVTPNRRLAIHDAQNMRGGWELRVSADDVPLAVHPFGWRPSVDETLRRHVREDGELSNELRGMLAENRLQTMSLDDLLAHQEEEDGEQRQAGRR